MIHSLTPRQFQDFVCDRIAAMGFEPKQVGDVYRKDGGIDILFWPRKESPLPFLGAVQVKHHAGAKTREGPSSVRDFSGAIANHPINLGLLVTNSTFTADARWLNENHAQLIRLRDFDDIRRWVYGNFTGDEEWRDFPKEIEVCPGVKIRIP